MYNGLSNGLGSESPVSSSGSLKSSKKRVSFDTDLTTNQELEEGLVRENGQILTGTLRSLIRKFIPSKDCVPESNYIFAFLLNARLFISPTDLLHEITQFCVFEQNKSAESLRKDSLHRFYQNMVNVVEEWTDNFPSDFASVQAHSQLSELTDLCLASDPSLHKRVTNLMENLDARISKLNRYEAALNNIRNHGSVTLWPSEHLQGFCSSGESPQLIAQQLTHIELERLSMIGPEELVYACVNEYSINILTLAEGSLRRKNIGHYKEWFDRLSYLTASEICRHVKKKHRCQAIDLFIDIAKECFNIGNFNSVMAIFSGLNLNAVARLRKTWSKVERSKHDVLGHQLDPAGNFGSYRATLKAAEWRSGSATRQCEKIIVPFFSLLEKDLLYLHKGCSKRLPNGHIDFAKFRKFAEPVQRFQEWKHVECPFPQDTPLLQRLLTGPVFSEKALLLSSFECEPPESSSEKELHKQLKSRDKAQALVQSMFNT